MLADCHSRYAWARLYPSKLPLTAVHTMNHDVIPTFEEHGAKIEVTLIDAIPRRNSCDWWSGFGDCNLPESDRWPCLLIGRYMNQTCFRQPKEIRALRLGLEMTLWFYRHYSTRA